MILERMYRALLLVYPSGHRQEYGESMVQLFRDRMRRDGRGIRALIVWVQVMTDLVCSAFLEYKEGFMFEGSQAKTIVVGSGKFLLQSLVWAITLYMVATLAFLTAGLVSLTTGWFPFSIESGPLGFLGFTMNIDNRTNWSLMFEFSPPGFFILLAAAGILMGARSVIRALNTSVRP